VCGSSAAGIPVTPGQPADACLPVLAAASSAAAVKSRKSITVPAVMRGSIADDPAAQAAAGHCRLFLMTNCVPVCIMKSEVVSECEVNRKLTGQSGHIPI